MSARDGALTITDKRGVVLRSFQLATLERVGLRSERLGWGLVAARDERAALRRARRLWPSVVVLDVWSAP